MRADLPGIRDRLVSLIVAVGLAACADLARRPDAGRTGQVSTTTPAKRAVAKAKDAPAPRLRPVAIAASRPAARTALATPPAPASTSPKAETAPPKAQASIGTHADFGRWRASRSARRVADWAVASKDHGGEPFMIVDKPNARLFVFDGRGRVLGAAPVLLGLARGDHTVPGIGDKPLAQIRDEERTTPAGRFVAERGRNLKGDDILWIDYDAAVSMHRVRGVNPGENRLHRLRTATVRDNRISYGCINVPAAFYDRVIETALGARATVVVYVLPDSRPLESVFGLGRVASSD